VKHVIVHSERPTPLRGEKDAASLQSTEELLDHRRLDARFTLPLRTRKGEVPGQRALTALEIGTALDLPLAMAKKMRVAGLPGRVGPDWWLEVARASVCMRLCSTSTPVSLVVRRSFSWNGHWPQGTRVLGCESRMDPSLQLKRVCLRGPGFA
jgi:hypothetical protein